MHVAILHYHLRPGGVTSVIRNALQALSEHRVRCVVIAGEAPHTPLPRGTAFRVAEELGYGEELPPVRAEALAVKLCDMAHSALGATPDLFHVHNHCLGKNAALPLAVHQLVRRNRRVLLQIHDFPEDFRPGNYRFLLRALAPGNPRQLAALLYPVAPHVHYAVLNSRDCRFMAEAELPRENLHLLPNAVSLPQQGETAQRTDSQRYFLYPTRGIRRKNLGELCLWAALGQKEDRFGLTRSPRNPAAQPVYRRWVACAESLKLPIQFEVAEKSALPYPVVLGRATALVTTSVGEGFGLAFVEPFLLKRPVVGRNLPEVTCSLREAGLALQGLYDALTVPVSWIGTETLRQCVSRSIEKLYTAYGFSATAEVISQALCSFIQAHRVDFGRLSEDLQEKVIRRVTSSPTDRSACMPSSLLPECYSPSLLEHNRNVVCGHFGLKRYGELLTELYRRVAASPAGPVRALNGEKLRALFLHPRRLNLLLAT